MVASLSVAHAIKLTHDVGYTFIEKTSERVFLEKYSNDPGIITNWYFSKLTKIGTRIMSLWSLSAI